METILLHLIWAVSGVSVSYMVASTIKHKADARVRESVALAETTQTALLLEEHLEERKAEHTNGAAKPRPVTSKAY